MAKLFAPSRRKFLTLTTAFVCAPAIVRASSLMPINSRLLIPTPQVSVTLTPQMIANEMARQMVLHGAIAAPTGAVWSGQKCVDLCIGNHEKTIPIDNFIDRYLRPAASALVSSGARVINQRAPILPVGVTNGAIGKYGDVSVRYLEHYNIFEDRLTQRFDVLH